MRRLVIPPALLRPYRQVLCEWLKANGINPADVPYGHPITIRYPRLRRRPPTIRYRRYIRDADGHKQLRGNNPATRWATATCTTPPPHLGPPPTPEAEQ